MANEAGDGARNGIVSGGNADDRAAVNFDDDEIYSGRTARVHSGGTTAAAGGDSGKIGPPTEQLSSSNGPSDTQPGAAERASGAKGKS